MGFPLTFGFRSAILYTEQTTNTRRGTESLARNEISGLTDKTAQRQGAHVDGEFPLCVFGPGGDFRTAWLPGPTVIRASVAPVSNCSVEKTYDVPIRST